VLNPSTRAPGGFPPLPYMKQDKAVAHIPDAASQALLCEAVTDAAVGFIKRHRTEPFLAYVPYTYVHLPRLSRQEWAQRAGGDETRAQIEELDAGVGRILDTIRDLGIAEKTLVFFTSDNGPARGCSAGPLRGAKSGPKYEGHMRMPTLAWWPGKIPDGMVCSEIGASIDILPTLAKITGAEVPTDRVIDGKDISALLFEPGAKSPHSELYYEYEGVRKGKWKLVRLGNAFKLYDLDADLGETKDLSAQYSEKAEELSTMLKAHEKNVAAARRPAGRAANPEPILESPCKLPTLAEYLGQADIKAVGSVAKELSTEKNEKKKKKGKAGK
jgi:arylsulfatase A